MPRGTLLTVNIEDEEVVIRVGIDVLKNLTELHLSPDDNMLVVSDPEGWAKEIAEIVNKPDEDNDRKTPIELMLQAAIDEASTYGSQWLEVSDPDDE